MGFIYFITSVDRQKKKHHEQAKQNSECSDDKP